MDLSYIKELIERLLDKHGIKREDLCEDGAIYYFNGNDGTEFDYGCNNMTCEFMCFYKDTEMGAIKLNQRGENLDAYVYDHDDWNKVLEEHIEKSPYALEDICNALWREFDKHDIYNQPIHSWEIDDCLSGPCYPESEDDENDLD